MEKRSFGWEVSPPHPTSTQAYLTLQFYMFYILESAYDFVQKEVANTKKEDKEEKLEEEQKEETEVELVDIVEVLVAI